MQVDATKAIENSLKITFPAWPLKNIVATHPFWNFRERPFSSELKKLEKFFPSSLTLEATEFLEKFETQEISRASLLWAIEKNKTLYPQMETGLEGFLRKVKESSPSPSSHGQDLSFVHFMGHTKEKILEEEVGKWCALFYQKKEQTPLGLFSFFMEHHPDKEEIRSFQGQNCWEVLSTIYFSLGFVEKDFENYLLSLNLRVIGWNSWVQYLEWQKKLGYEIPYDVEKIDVLAIAAVCDYLTLKKYEKDHPHTVHAWKEKIRSFGNKHVGEDFSYRHTFLLAWERELQRKIASELNWNEEKQGKKDRPIAQFVFCIDVRSENVRRSLEKENPGFSTLGFAGFFGMGIELHHSLTGEKTALAPIFFKPSIPYTPVSEKKEKNLYEQKSFFQQLKKSSQGSYFYVEYLGGLKFFPLLKNYLSQQKTWKKQKFIRFSAPEKIVDLPWTIEEKIQKAKFILTHLSFNEPIADIVFLIGHTSEGENNPLVSSLRCGACGGNSGKYNALLAAQVLNDQDVRKHLEAEGSFQIPKSCRFIPAIHETVTDTLEILQECEDIIGPLIPSIQNAFQKASEKRQAGIHSFLDPDTTRRTKDWAQLRTELGLSNNACFIIAPRSRSQEMDLQNQAFLHEYNWHKDSQQDYQTLDLIMSAPMIVATWINYQYYASSVCPDVYSSGDKRLHNILHNFGVLEGNSGDLKVGLPLQSLFYKNKRLHDPRRLSVFIHAPQNAIEKIIEKHENVRYLIDNEWIHLIQMDPEKKSCYHRNGKNSYTPLL